ncbi:DUF3194 domain-containing protein [Thermococci archaeon]|uniref:DUF3194 domain-containing protein n=1 Tax=Palaeococcus sp. (in: euryarchaeotes) TaxID=2820298 RepID=UPI000F159F44|nr:DUF3194 domain-containing protein [Palaeococcus sp. (in: euryarchaeotes)]MCD6558403.1 DUF3194 domain-containing protein [Palaeococcus sp. (in: euryarchaeotes)]RLF75873.1 MAG: DUF3194 domain-containing protein [Thermococci archaeon]RLF90918.1 MAG: DUF3194 domain-containing protein [Thermococci archaeon]
MRKVIHIGLPELDEEDIIALGDVVQEVILKHIFDSLHKSDVKDIEVTTRINQEDTLDLEVDVYIEVPIFVKADVDRLVEEALDMAYEKVEERLREIARENKA